jgi:putative transcriptional regulator
MAFFSAEARLHVMMGTKRFLKALCGIFFLVALCAAVPPKPGSQSRPPSFAGQLLIASPQMGDPRFRHTVILMVRHGRDGALGIVINRPAGKISLARLLESLGEKGTATEGEADIFAGGPVQPAAAFVTHNRDYQRAETIGIDGELAVTSNVEVFRDLAHGKGPSKALIAFGYAGWGPGQLEGEMAARAWFTAAANPALIFDERRERVWDVAVERRLHDL